MGRFSFSLYRRYFAGPIRQPASFKLSPFVVLKEWRTEIDETRDHKSLAIKMVRNKGAAISGLCSSPGRSCFATPACRITQAMDAIKIPEDQIIPIAAVAPGVQGLRIAFVNVFSVIHQDGSWTLIDAAIPFSFSIIRNWAEKNFKRAPNAIVLTHGHFDHVGAARDLADHWDVPVYAHALEFSYLTGEKEYPKPNVAAGGGLMTLLSPLYPRSPVNLQDRLMALPAEENGAESSILPGWDVIHSPGHTPGHVSFFRREDRTLLAGDAFCTTKPESFFEAAIAQQPELHGPPAYFTQDWNQARASVQQLASLDPLIVAPGHGKPMAGAGVPEALRQLASRFDEIAVPENKKPAA